MPLCLDEVEAENNNKLGGISVYSPLLRLLLTASIHPSINNIIFRLFIPIPI